jgi:hypothetical protein
MLDFFHDLVFLLWSQLGHCLSSYGFGDIFFNLLALEFGI